MKMPIRNSLGITTASALPSFSINEFAEYQQIYQTASTWCGQNPSATGGTCYQEFPITTFTSYSSTPRLNYIGDALNQPVQKAPGSVTYHVIDQNAGWTVQFINTFDLQLQGGGASRFFGTDTQDAPIKVATVDTWMAVDPDSYMNTVLPLNGTDAWPTGQHDETFTDDRRGGAIVGIVALAVLTLVGLLLLGVFFKLHSDAGKAAGHVVYGDEAQGLTEGHHDHH